MDTQNKVTGISTKRTCILVLGMHRSGSSAVTRVLNLLGADLPKTLMPPSDTNLAGYWESQPIMDVNDALLSKANSRWDDWMSFNEGALSPDELSAFEYQIADTIIAELSDAPVTVLKDPRIARLMPVYTRILRSQGFEVRCVHITRSPVEVAQSLHQRDMFSTEFSFLLWLRHTLEAEKASRELDRIFVTYNELMSENGDAIQRIAEWGSHFGLSATAASVEKAAAHLRDNLRHFTDSEEWLHAHNKALTGLVGNTYLAVKSMGADSLRPNATAVLDVNRADLDRAAVISGPSFKDLMAKLSTVENACHSNAVELDAAKAERDQLIANTTALQTHLLDQKTALSQAAAELDAAKAERDQLIANTTALQTHLLDQKTEAMGLRTELAQLRRKPARGLKEHIIHRALTKLASGRLPISDRAQARFARSARKRDPNRSLNTGQTANSQPAPLPPAASQAARPHHLQTLQGHIARDPERRNVLVLAHEASFTGAPILAQNVMRVLAERYNVFAISIRGGELVAPFLECTVETMIIGSPPDPASGTYRKVKSFLAERNIEFGIANSIEARYLLPILNELDIASVSLIHEFASYTQQKHAYRDAISLSDEAIFSTQLTLDNAADEASIELSPYIHVLPQGKCVVPGAATDANTHELQRLKSHLRPPGHEDDFLVIGAGYVHFRKGVDLFIEVARHAQAQAAGRALRFVWIGGGYDPDNEMAFCVFLRDQMKRSGVQDIVHFIPATTEIDQAYDIADLLLVPSRLDPLPNVAIDAMLAGTPVLCFEKANGIANVLEASGIADVCVADYMDTADMTGKLLALAQSPDLYADIATRTQSHAQEIFDLQGYIHKVETLALAARDRKHSKIGDASIIAAEPLFDPAYVIPPHHDLLTQRSGIQRLDVAKAYLDTLSKSNWARRPEPGFSPHIYAQHMRDRDGEVTSNPYADFLKRGRPQGPWLLPVLSGGEDVKLSEAAATQRVALHIHAYYTDMMAELLDKLAQNQSRPDLHITVCSPEAQTNLQEVLARYDGTYTVHRVPNIGRDIGPFLTSVGPQLMRDYDIIGHVHIKKSIALSNDTLVKNWTQFVFENTLGGTEAGAMTDRALNAFAADPKLGIVFPADPNVLNWARNRLIATDLAEKIGISALPELFDFPVGTMFWSRADAIRPLIDLELTSKDYPKEPIGIDGTILHALERLFGIVPVWQGYSAAVTTTPGLTR